jgi:uncharacterized repeat protein (TIGR03803 family)
MTTIPIHSISTCGETRTAKTSDRGMRGLAAKICFLALWCIGLSAAAQSQTFKSIVVSDWLSGTPIQGTDGNFYATTTFGGSEGQGSVFRVSAAGTMTTLYSFCSLENCTDGEDSYSGVIQATDGNFYGTTFQGGTSSQGAGTVFKVTPAGKLTTLYNFCSQPNCSDGSSPYAGLVEGLNGKLYGVTSPGAFGEGIIFSITTTGTLTTLHTFCSETNCLDGAVPPQANPLVLGSDGNFYGTTIGGGANNAGTFYRITPAGKYTVLYSFASCTESSCPDGESINGLVQASNGNFYGTTALGGANNSYLCNLGKSGEFGCGTIFEVTPAGKFTVIHNFCAQPGCTDGSYTLAALTAGSDGNLYGTTNLGGANLCGVIPNQLGCGSIFRITPSGEFATLYNFCQGIGCYGGGLMYSLSQATNGELIGNGGDVIYSLSVGLGPFVETRPTAGKVGLNVVILGNDLKTATSVTFGGVAADFELVSDTEIRATVPSGATTGSVAVTTSTGVLQSNVTFRIL